MSTERDQSHQDAPKSRPSANQTSGSEMTSPPAGGSEKVGATYNPGPVRTNTNLIISVVALVVALVVIALVVLFILNG